MFSFNQIVEKINQNQVIAYPTEAVFGLGCNPKSELAIETLLWLKKRPVEKGLILVASSSEFLLPYINTHLFTQKEWDSLEKVSEQAITWVVPAKSNVSRYLTGQFDTIAVRICRLPSVVKLCQATGTALTSTSANLATYPPCRTAAEVRAMFGKDFPVLDEETGKKDKPSEIRDIFTQHIFRQG
ncbi:L-threonylcarbamoyladenylate synthase [Nicoletella semolina]|uniref:Threonylcarbamoyl-AMP synthase n=1 Tax=Nicoletella semolina TaxID=271160 RepID=A0A4R2N8T9_9PAST|nr:Sua5/YciO/YrdC/YwlC family protein [Nicoletella semolina]MDH2924474.1 tRNA threonylcarbamoyladenosine biosynthesis protein RimN [Nicoletella semolina]TCP17400.1 L-threonylcarbamoyladenylate synthase [Nicoletella semolina]